MKWFFLSTVLILNFSLSAQVKHNFKMDPKNTDCHQLPPNLESMSVDSVKALIISKKYRFKQEVTLSKYRLPRSLAYFSCEGEQGFMIAKEDESQTAIYKDLPKTLWDALINHKDPLDFYNNPEIKKHLLLKN